MGAAVLWKATSSGIAAAIAVDDKFAYTLVDKSDIVIVLDKQSGLKLADLKLASSNGGTPYGSLAVAGDSLFLGRAKTVERFHKGTGAFLDSFIVKDIIYNMSFDGKDYCVSANNSDVSCYTIATKPPSCP
jgi:hypothetical protein